MGRASWKQMMMLRIALLSAALVFVLPIVTVNVGLSTTTNDVGSHGAHGTLFMGLYTAHFSKYPTGGSVTCNDPIENDLVKVKDEMCDIGQIAFPILFGLFIMALALHMYDKAMWLMALLGLLLASMWGIAVAILAMLMDKDTYSNVEHLGHPELSWGAVAILLHLLCLVMVALQQFLGKEAMEGFDFSNILMS
jgi:hypothetical protein